MNRAFLILRHELLHTMKRTGFIVLTVTPPILALLAIGIYQIASRAKPRAETTERTIIGYVDQSGGFERFTSQGNITLRRYDGQPAAVRALTGEEIESFFVIPSDFMSNGKITLYSTHRRLAVPEATTAAIKAFVSSNLLEGKVPEAAIERVETPLDVKTVTLSPTGAVARQQGGYGNFIIPAAFGLLLALSLTFSSGYMVQGLSEEKENRLIEIILSSVSTRQLLAGKVLGFGVAGLLQVAAWVVAIPLLLALASSSIGGFLRTIQLPPGFWALAILYFILGYGLFAVLSASVSAVSRTVREAQGIIPLFTLFSVAPLWFLSLLMIFPDSPAWVVFSIFPFSAPVLVLLRIGLTGVPPWQLAASMGVLAACTVGGLLLAAKLLRVYLLMYGKRPTIKEIARSLRSG